MAASDDERDLRRLRMRPSDVGLAANSDQTEVGHVLLPQDELDAPGRLQPVTYRVHRRRLQPLLWYLTS